MPQQNITQCNHGAGFAGAGCHHQQRFPAVLLERLTGGFDGAFLVPSAGNAAVHFDGGQAGPHGPEVEQLLQIPLGIEGCHLPLGVDAVVEIGVEAVGQEDHRPAAALPLQDVGIQLGLLAALGRVHAGPFGLDHSQRAVGIIVQDIVRPPFAGVVGHAGQNHLVDPVFPLSPSGIGQQGINIELSGLVLGQFQGPGRIAGLLRRPAGGQLLAQGLVFSHQGCKVHFGRRGRGGGCRFRCGFQQRRVKGSLGVALAVAAGHKVHEIIQIFQAEGGLVPGDMPLAVGGIVAGLAYVVHPPPQIFAHHLAEFLCIHQAGQPVIIGLDQRFIHRVHPLDGKLHSPAAVKRTGSRVDGKDPFRQHRRLGKAAELRVGKEKIKICHWDHLTFYNQSMSMDFLLIKFI